MADRQQNKDAAQTVTGYRIMWVMVMFDLPVDTPERRRQAVRFRNDLLDLGFNMTQFSIYMKFCANRDVAASLKRQVNACIPPKGTVSLISFTDKQYEQMEVWHGRTADQSDRSRKQLRLF